MNKFTNILADIIHTACAAEISGDEAIQRQALGDIYDAITSVLPVDHARLARGASPTVADYASPIQPDTPRIDGRACRQATAEDGSTGFNKFLTVAEGVRFVRFTGNGETRLIASRRGANDHQKAIFEIYVDHEEDVAKVFRDNRVMFTITGYSIGHSFIKKLAISAMHRYFKENRLTNEKKKRKRARIAESKRSEEIRDGILTTEQEIAETVRRQQEEA